MFFIELDTGRIHVGGVTANPDGGWVTQQARNLLLVLDERGRRVRFLLGDRDAKFPRSFDEVVCSEGGEVLVTPVRVPQANADVGRGHLEQVHWVYVRPDNGHRPHRAVRAATARAPARLTILDEDPAAVQCPRTRSAVSSLPRSCINAFMHPPAFSGSGPGAHCRRAGLSIPS